MINDINTLADYLGPRDLPALTPAALEGKYGIPQADAFVLFGSQPRAHLWPSVWAICCWIDSR
ncbi:hypothetical protein BTH65_05080 [Lactobacillus delbrueckii subsp. bulgaricus]|nr:hypothetical protein [Lactobacillus delbrueckii]MBT8805196.1 hypothetical protein [Lactobacillus delbrueckii subsp. bulgaricus]MBT8812770.1 hypothetical protein [Lactobacillus delbrueckii subsp. bulgaricus]MBT8819362.1 hypothetical protein [Lactobacillus delbrueckii subsp. bulgaricus]MBT8820709.1 hypothetical protein [Lactobacillus delbrueckii subsp. bulgaricus]MBT8822517.1 hypothetical protein [Lactobacillus delbrueckii subsp. bulgaricus]